MKLKRILFRLRTFGRNSIHTSIYWESRYKDGGNSGSGSYGRLAEFKAEVINAFVKKNNVISVVELGCGDGNQLRLLDIPRYIGLDVSKTIIKSNVSNFRSDSTKSFLRINKKNIEKCKQLGCDLSISLDVIFHLVEDNVFENYMNHLFDLSSKFVIIYSSNVNMPLSPYEKHRNFIPYVKKKYPQWELVETIMNRYPFIEATPNETSLSDFYIFKLKDANNYL